MCLKPIANILSWKHASVQFCAEGFHPCSQSRKNTVTVTIEVSLSGIIRTVVSWLILISLM